jgi:hypothetical protein
MTNAEQEQLQQFLSQLTAIRLAEKDPTAESLIFDALAKQPDAAYLLVQRCLLQNQALQTAQSQISDLQNQLKQKEAQSQANQFLNNDPWAQAANQSNAANVPGASTYKVPNNIANLNPQDYSRPLPQTPNQGLGSSFLGNMATTAAGVVAGSFLFQGIGNLLGHHHASPEFDRHATADHNDHEQMTNHPENNENSPFHLASDDDSDSFFTDSDSDSDWI